MNLLKIVKLPLSYTVIYFSHSILIHQLLELYIYSLTKYLINAHMFQHLYWALGMENNMEQGRHKFCVGDTYSLLRETTRSHKDCTHTLQ